MRLFKKKKKLKYPIRINIDEFKELLNELKSLTRQLENKKGELDAKVSEVESLTYRTQNVINKINDFKFKEVDENDKR